MPDVHQNFFHKALAVIFAKAQYQKKAIGELYRVIPFPAAHSMYAEVYVHISLALQTFIEQKYKRAPLVLHRFVRH